MSELTQIGNDVTAQLVHAMVLAGVAEAYGLTPHDDYGPEDEEIVAPTRGSGDNSNKEGTDA